MSKYDTKDGCGDFTCKNLTVVTCSLVESLHHQSAFVSLERLLSWHRQDTGDGQGWYLVNALWVSWPHLTGQPA